MTPVNPYGITGATIALTRSAMSRRHRHGWEDIRAVRRDSVRLERSQQQ
jgi:hypothetical protein